MDIQQQTLLKVLSDNAGTDYGRRYGFSEIKSASEFRERLPISTYDDYAPLIALMTRLGESNIFTSDKLVCYNLSFGPDASARLIPCTRGYVKLFDSRLTQMLRIGRGRVFSLCTCLPATQRFNDGVYMNTISGTLLNECAGINARWHGKDSNPFTSPPEMLCPSGLYDQRYVRALFALAQEDVKLIYAPYAGVANNFFDFLRENWESLVEDVDSGIIGSHGDLPVEFQLPEALRSQLIKRLRANPTRARMLAHAFSDGFNKPIARRLWPNLDMVVAESGSEDDKQTLKRYIGDVPHNNGLYFTAEALIARSVQNESDERILLPEAGFFEYIDQDDPLSGNTLTMNQLRPGGRYEIIVTNCQGLYRYRLGDIIRVERIQGDIPVITVEYRSNAAIPTYDDNEARAHMDVYRTMVRALEHGVSAHC